MSMAKALLYGTRNHQTVDEEIVYSVREDIKGEMIHQLNTEEWAEICQKKKVEYEEDIRYLQGTASSSPKNEWK